MISLIGRNLRLFSKNRMGMVFSVLAALISFVLYLVFLKNNMMQSWVGVPHKQALLDLWLMGGTMGVSAVTTTSHGLSQMVKDRERGLLEDLLLTDLNGVRVQLAYAISAVLIGVVMQLIVFGVLVGYFGWADNLRVSWSIIPVVLGLIILNSFLWTAINMFIMMFVRRVDVLSTINSIVGTASGFFVGVYMPIGSLPKTAQHVLEWTPAPYSAAVYRHVLMKSELGSAFQHAHASVLNNFNQTMGVTISAHGWSGFNSELVVVTGVTVIFVILVMMTIRRSNRLALQRG